MYVTQVVRLLDSLTSYLQSLDGKENTGTVQATDLLKGKGVDQINLYKLMHYLQESKLARKVEGYASLEQQQKRQKDGAADGLEAAVPVLTHIQNLFMVLTNPAREGRLFYTAAPDKAQTRIKYLLLDPSEHFREIVDEARAVILAGGTMSPVCVFPFKTSSFLDGQANFGSKPDERLPDATVPLSRQHTHNYTILRPRNPALQSLRQPRDPNAQRHAPQLHI